MINLYKFWNTTQAEGFSLDDVPLAIRDSIEYTYGDAVRNGDIRYNDGADWVEGVSQPIFFATAVQNPQANQAYCITVYDGAVAKLGLIVLTSDAEYARYHSMMEQEGMRAAIAAAFGYDDAIVITGDVAQTRTYVTGGGADDYRTAGLIPTYATQYVADTNWRDVALADRPAASAVIGSAFPGGDLTKRNPVCFGYTSGTVCIAAPLEHYNTDSENMTTINTACDAILEARLTAVKSAVAGVGGAVSAEESRAKYVEDAIMDTVEALPVFGLSLITAVESANNMREAQQYIPRP